MDICFDFRFVAFCSFNCHHLFVITNKPVFALTAATALAFAGPCTLKQAGRLQLSNHKSGLTRYSQIQCTTNTLIERRHYVSLHAIYMQDIGENIL